jgi:CheY-like chemotaxis protein
MPNLDGYALIARVRDLEQHQGGHVIAIALTAHVQAEDRERAFALRFDGFLPKPVVPDELFRPYATVCRTPPDRLVKDLCCEVVRC